jgi:hypothetical protein
MSGIEFSFPVLAVLKSLAASLAARTGAANPVRRPFHAPRLAVGDTGESDYVFDQVFDDASDQAASRE